MNMYDMLKNLISKKYYKTKGEIVEKLNVFYAYGVLTTEHYQELMALTNEMYPDETNDSGEDSETK